MSETTLDQVEHELISTSLEVESLDTNLFRSRSLRMPPRGRGVFGGQVISQAVVSATNCVDPAYGLHSLHCYFLLSASPEHPILYYVDRLRDGRSYATRFVRAVQRGKIIFILMCSFHKPEPEHPIAQWHMPADAPMPEEIELDIDFYRRRLLSENLSDAEKTVVELVIRDRERSPVSVTVQIERTRPDGSVVAMHWMKARGIPKYGPAFQKCILGYMSDMNFIPVAARTAGMRRYNEKGPLSIGMTSSLDHAIFFYNDTFDCSDWILYVVQSPRTGSGRGVVQGQMYTRNGTLVAVTTQEGVIRANIDRSAEPQSKVHSKL